VQQTRGPDVTLIETTHDFIGEHDRCVCGGIDDCEDPPTPPPPTGVLKGRRQ
jgi:hypothetical protein